MILPRSLDLAKFYRPEELDCPEAGDHPSGEQKGEKNGSERLRNSRPAGPAVPQGLRLQRSSPAPMTPAKRAAPGGAAR